MVDKRCLSRVIRKADALTENIHAGVDTAARATRFFRAAEIPGLGNRDCLHHFGLMCYLLAWS